MLEEVCEAFQKAMHHTSNRDSHPSYPVCVCAAGLCIGRVSLCMYMYVYMCEQKIDLFCALPFKNFCCVTVCVLYYLIVEFKRH